MNFGWNLFTATRNIKLVSFFLSSLLYPKRQFIWKTVTEQRITELPNCFIPSSISLSLSISLTLSFAASSSFRRRSRRRGRLLLLLFLLLQAIVKALNIIRTHTHARELYVQKEMVEERERERKSRITVGMMGTF